MNTSLYVESIRKYGLSVGLLLVGVGLVVGGVVSARSGKPTAKIEVTHPVASTAAEVNSPEEVLGEVVVDVSGAVVSPGVYKMKLGTRVAEALVAAGGLSKKAHQAYVAKNINQAAVLVDGMKIYIPFMDEDVGTIESTVLGTSQAETTSQGVLSVNQASQSELETLWGIGEVRASAIVDNRPYTSLAEMAEKANIPASVMEKNEGKWGI